MRGATVAACALIAGCFNPTLSAIDCGVGASCPDGLICDLPSNQCVREVGELPDAGVDAATFEFEFSNGVSPADTEGAGVVTFEASVLIDTDSGQITAGNETLRSAGEGLDGGVRFTLRDDIAVFGFEALTVAVGVTVRLVGSRAVILVATETMSIGGAIDAGAGSCDGVTVDTRCAGPGGGAGATDSIAASGCGPGGDGVNNGDLGGGGGAFGTDAASGGDETDEMMAAGGAAGSASDCNPDLDPLVGGSGGGHSGDAPSPDADGGGGGGGLQLAAGEMLAVLGIVAAPGEGGTAGGTDGGGGGGGSGGGILLESSTVVVHGAVTANGGGGAGGSSMNSGERGRVDLVVASGGSSSISSGGNGGIEGTAPTQGEPSINDTGGGGGSVGVIEINGESIELDTGAIISPSPTP